MTERFLNNKYSNNLFRIRIYVCRTQFFLLFLVYRANKKRWSLFCLIAVVSSFVCVFDLWPLFLQRINLLSMELRVVQIAAVNHLTWKCLTMYLYLQIVLWQHVATEELPKKRYRDDKAIDGTQFGLLKFYCWYFLSIWRGSSSKTCRSYAAKCYIKFVCKEDTFGLTFATNAFLNYISISYR